MPRTKRAVVHSPICRAELFESAEAAWFWFARCQTLRYEGARFDRFANDVERPCDPDDIYRVLMQLRRSGLLGPQHVAVLVRFGAALRPPDPRHTAETHAARLWDEALDRLTTPLRVKGIVKID